MTATKRPSAGFSMAELLLAFGLLTIAILALGGLSLSALKTGQKSSNVMDASQVAIRQLAAAADAAAPDAAFWDNDYTTTPYRQGTQMVGKTEYTYEVYAVLLYNAQTGDTLGSGAAGNRVKKMDILVEWYAQSASPGYGKKNLRETCLVNEAQ